MNNLFTKKFLHIIKTGMMNMSSAWKNQASGIIPSRYGMDWKPRNMEVFSDAVTQWKNILKEFETNIPEIKKQTRKINTSAVGSWTIQGLVNNVQGVNWQERGAKASEDTLKLLRNLFGTTSGILNYN